MVRTKNTRSPAWSIVNWAVIQAKIEEEIAIIPDQTAIEDALNTIEAQLSDEELFLKEAEELEELLIENLLRILKKTRGKEIKRSLVQKEREKQKKPASQNLGVQVFGPFGNMGDLKDMGMDPDMIDQLSKGLMDQLFGKKKKKDDDDDDEEEPGSSFYM